MLRNKARMLLGTAISAAAIVAALAAPASAATSSTSHSALNATQSADAPFTVRVVKGSPGAPERQEVTPDSDSGCVGNNPWNNIQTCISINGSGLHVNTMTATSYVYLYPVVEHVQLSGPSVNYETLDFVIDQGGYLQLTWNANRNVAAGSYCATSWVVNGSGGYSNQGTDCQPVFS